MFPLWSFLSIGLAGAYSALIFAYWRGWRALPLRSLPAGFQPRTSVTVAIPARNEAANIGACLRSILEGSYPPNLLEIIVVDDFSNDETAAVVRAFKGQNTRIKLIALADFFSEKHLNSHKKKALEIAIDQARGELIVTTDADCVAPPDWLKWLASVFEAGRSPDERLEIALEEQWAPKILAAPVAFRHEHNLLQRFQSLDFLGMMGVTGAGIRMGWQRLGNGANLAYPKAVFVALGGYAGADAHASGDDLFLLQKAARRWPRGIFFLKNTAATVLTEAMPDWRSFFAQRLRWGAKNAALPEPGAKIALLLVFLLCWSIVVNVLIIWLLHPALLWVPLAQLLVKAVADFFFLREMCRFFGRRDLLRSFAPAFFLHIFYIAAVGAASLFFRKYRWKGRRVQ